MTDEYKSAIKRINKASTEDELLRVEKSLARLYGNGVFSESEYRKLDALLLAKWMRD